MALNFYYAPHSTASITQAVLAELGTPHEAKLTPIGPTGTKSAEFLKLNPNGRVPVIVHDGQVMWESAAITMYLGEVFGEAAKLYPPLGPMRGKAMTWIVWGSVCLAEAGSRLSCALSHGAAGGVEAASQDFEEGKGHDAQKEKKARDDIAGCLQVLNVGLEQGPYLLGEEYSIVDTHIASLLGWFQMMEVDMSNFPHLQAWLKQVQDRPVLKNMHSQ